MQDTVERISHRDGGYPGWEVENTVDVGEWERVSGS